MMKSCEVLGKSESKEISVVKEHPGVGDIMIACRGVFAMAMNGVV